VRYLAFLLLLCCFTGTASAVQAEDPEAVRPVPLWNFFQEIRRKQHVDNVFDCSNKAASYALALDAAGYAVEVWFSPVLYRNQKGVWDTVNHAYVRIIFDEHTGECLYADPTTGAWSLTPLGLSRPGFTYRDGPYWVLSIFSIRLRQDDPNWVAWDRWKTAED
jgi:hypothetical protein